MSVFNSQPDRINHAVRVLVNNGPYNRTFDTCFEMDDGGEVTHAILRRSLRNQELKTALESGRGLRFDYIVELDRERYGDKAIYPA